MKYLLNNPFILFVSLLVIGFTLFMITKLIEEVKLNKKLNIKHMTMRIKTTRQPFIGRIGLLGSAALAPVAALALLLIVQTPNQVFPIGEVLGVKDASDIMEIYEDFQDKYQTQSYFWRNPLFTDAENVVDDGAVPEGDGDQGSDDYSETNNQVLGVDEMDNVVTDGKYIYSIQGSRVFITLAFTQSLEAEALSNYKVIDLTPQVSEDECPYSFYTIGLYVDEDYLVVLGNDYQYYCSIYGNNVTEDYFYDIWYYNQDQDVNVYVFDKSDDFSLNAEYEVKGNYIGTRKIDDDLYIVTNTYIPFYDEDLVLDDYLSTYTVDGVERSAKYDDIIYVEGTSPTSYTNFYAIDLDNKLVDMEVILGDNGYNLFVSQDNIYLVGNIYYFYPENTLFDFDNEPNYENKTAILKIAVDGPNIDYVGNGIVSGYTLDQFSMDEYQGNLRIATTSGWWWDIEINNRVYILDENLEQISVIENLGKPGERIQSVRFVGEYGYLVTFLQTDPFYVLDLSDPEQPEIEGELEIPGFSTYLQPFGENYMLGIGFNADNDGRTNGLKVSIYDISDKENPTVFSEEIFYYSDFGWAWSSATYNHKDLLVSVAKGLIALPFSTYDYDNNVYSYNSGIIVFHFDETDGLVNAGFVQHAENSVEDVYVYKSKFISEYFYTVSNKYIKVSTIEDPETILYSVELPNE